MRESELEAIQSAFSEAAALPQAERRSYLELHYSGQHELHAKVNELLRYHDAPQRVLDSDLGQRVHPQQIGRYRILGVLGSGGIGIVYRAEQERPRRQVAVKLLQPAQLRPETTRRFALEAELLARLQHPGIAQIYEAGFFDSGFGEAPYFAMELIAGESLTRFANGRKLLARERCELLLQVCEAVSHAHERGIVHRDLKPENILVAEPTQGDAKIKVLDFGIARVLGEAADAATWLTHTGQMVGTLPYMSPEQISGGAIDVGSDVYALGAILYELLAGRCPLEFEGHPLTQVVRIVTEEEPERISRLAPGLGRDLDTIVAVALAKEQDRRYPSVRTFADDLRRYLADEPIVARPQTTFYRLYKFARRNRALVGGTLATLLVLVAGLIAVSIYSVKNRELARSEHAARTDERRNRYVAEMNLAGNALAVGALARVQQLVEGWRQPPPDQPDLRGFEWHFLSAASRGEERIVETGRIQSTISWISDEMLATQEEHGGAIHSLVGGVPPLRFEVEASHTVAVCSPDARWFAVSRDRDIQIFDCKTRSLRTTLPTGGASGGLAWLPGADRLGVLTPAGTTELWDVERRARVREFGTDVAHAFAFSADGKQYVRGLSSGGVEVGDVESGSSSSRHGVAHDGCFGCAFSPDGKAVAFGTGRMTNVVEVASGKLLGSITHQNRVTPVVWSPDGRFVAAGGHDCVVHVLELANGEVTSRRGHGNAVLGLAYSNDGQRLASASEDGTLRIWARSPRSALRRIGLSRRLNDDLYFSRLSWGREGELSVSTLENEFTDLIAREGTVTRVPGYVAPTAEGRVTVRLVESRNKLEGILQLDSDTGASDQWRLPAGHRRHWPCKWPFFSAGGSRVAAALTGPEGDSVWVWRPFEGQSPQKLQTAAPTFMAWSRDGKLLAWLANGQVYCGDPDQGVPAPVRRIERATLVCIGPSGEQLAVADSFRRIHLFSPKKEQGAQVLRGHTQLIRALDWHPDGTRIASGGNDRMVKIWDVASGSEVLSLPLAGDVSAVAWRPDGKALAAVSSDGVVTVWSAELEPGNAGR